MQEGAVLLPSRLVALFSWRREFSLSRHLVSSRFGRPIASNPRTLPRRMIRRLQRTADARHHAPPLRRPSPRRAGPVAPLLSNASPLPTQRRTRGSKQPPPLRLTRGMACVAAVSPRTRTHSSMPGDARKPTRPLREEPRPAPLFPPGPTPPRHPAPAKTAVGYRPHCRSAWKRDPPCTGSTMVREATI